MRSLTTSLRRPNLLLAVVLLFGGVARFGFTFHRRQPVIRGYDAAGYVDQANLLEQGQFFAAPRHPPVYPTFLWLVFVVSNSLPVALIAHAAVGTLTIYLVYLLGLRTGSTVVGLGAAAIVAVDPFEIFYSTLFMSETLFIAFFLLSFLGMAHAWRRQSLPLAVATGIGFGVSVLCRGILLPCLPFLIVYGAWTMERSRRIAMTSALCLGVALPLFGWSAFVHAKTGRWLLVDNHKWETLYWSFAPNFEPVEAEKFVRSAADEADRAGLRDQDDVERFYKAKSLANFRAHPAGFARLSVRKFFKFWSLAPRAEVFSPSVRLISLLFMLPLVGASIAGAFFLRRDHDWAGGLMIVSIAAYTLVNCIFWTQVRYRIPIHPLLAVLAAVGVASMLRRRHSPLS